MNYYDYYKYYKNRYLLQKGGMIKMSFIRKKINEFYKMNNICESPNFYLDNFRSLRGLTPGMSNSAILIGDLNLGDVEMGKLKIPVIIKEITIPCKYLDNNIDVRKSKFERDIRENKTVYSDSDGLIMEIGLTKLFCDDILMGSNDDATKISNNFLEFYFFTRCENIFPNKEKISKCTRLPIEVKYPVHNFQNKDLYKNLLELYVNGKFMDDTNIMLVEKGDGDLTGLLEECYIHLRKNNIDDFIRIFNPLFMSILKQTINCLVTLNFFYEEFYHNDMHLGNILFVRKKPEKLTFDVINHDKNIILRNEFNDYGVCIKMWDFATSYAKKIFDRIGEIAIKKSYKDDFPIERIANHYSKNIKDEWLHENFFYMKEDQIFNLMKRKSKDFESLSNHFDQFTLNYLKKYNIVHYFDLIKSQDSYKFLVSLKKEEFSDFKKYFKKIDYNLDKIKEDSKLNNYFRLYV